MNRRGGANAGHWSKLRRIAVSVVWVVAILSTASLFYPQYATYLELQRREAALEEACRADQETVQRLKQNQEALLTTPGSLSRAPLMIFIRVDLPVPLTPASPMRSSA